LRQLDRRLGFSARPGESNRDLFIRLAKRPAAYVPAEVYEELVSLQDRVQRLEAARSTVARDL
jgi:hypothetical protein